MGDLDHTLAAARPELVVTTLLQHALGAVRHALVIAHPELHDENFQADDVRDPAHLALLIALQLADLHDLLQHYRNAVEAEWRSYVDDIPF